MNRRQFASFSGAAAAALTCGVKPAPMSAATPRRALMKPGTDGAISDKNLTYLARFGVKNICSHPAIPDGRLYATVDELKRMRDVADKCGTSVDLLDPPFLRPNHVDTEKHAAIMLGESPQRDRDIESIQIMIRNCAAAGVPAIKYNLTLLGVLRNRNNPLPGRGDSNYRRWNLKLAR